MARRRPESSLAVSATDLGLEGRTAVAAGMAVTAGMAVAIGMIVATGVATWLRGVTVGELVGPEVGASAGGLACPEALTPQHSTEPSVLTPQVWNRPALTEAKEPFGGVAWPTTLPAPSSFSPQHSTVPFILTPQVW